MKRRLIETVGFKPRPVQRHDVDGELLPAESVNPVDAAARALVPVAQPPPVISINLPRAAEKSTDAAPVSEYERRKAQRAVTLETDAHVPMTQALFTAATFGASAGLLAWAFGWSWRVPVVVLALALTLGWLWRLRLMDGLLWEIETITGRDVNRDGQVGKPTFAPVIVNAHDARQEAARAQRANANQSELDELLRFVARCANVGCSEAAQGIGTSPSARAEFARKRDTLIALGVARWKDANRRRCGWELCVSPAQTVAILRQHIIGRDST